MAILTCIVRYYLMQWNDAQHHTLFSSVQSLTQSCLTLCDPMNRSMPGLPVHHHLPEFTQLMSIESVMPSSHLILCCPFFLLPPIPPSIRVFSNESTLPQGIVRYHLMQVRMAIIKKSTSNKFWRGCGEKGNFLHCWWECKLVQLLCRPFRYDLNQIPYDYTVEVRNRFKGLHLIDRCYTEPKRSMNLEGNSKTLVIRIVSVWLVTVNSVTSLN